MIKLSFFSTIRLQIIAILLLGFWVVFVEPTSATQLSTYEILRSSDQARGNMDGISWKVTLSAIEKSKTNRRKILTRSRGFDIVAETLEPARRKGHMLIMLKGNMWFYKPGLSKPVPISKRQKLLGLATNGDIASTNYADDYDILNQDQVLVESEECWQFDLQAKTANATYRRIRYWVSRRRLVGIKAEFYTTNGEKLLKSATMFYDNHITDVNGSERPFISSMVIQDELMSDGKTVLEFSPPSLQSISPNLFNINLLRN